jgi:hypothetical protein
MSDPAEGKVNIGSSKTVDEVIVLKTKNKKYKLWADKDIAKEGLEFFTKHLASYQNYVLCLARKCQFLLFGAI